MTQIWLKYYDFKWLIIINKSQHMSQTFQVMSHQYDSCLSIVISSTSTSYFGFDWFQVEFTEIRKGAFPCEILKKKISHNCWFISYDVIIWKVLWKLWVKSLRTDPQIKTSLPVVSSLLIMWSMTSSFHQMTSWKRWYLNMFLDFRKLYQLCKMALPKIFHSKSGCKPTRNLTLRISIKIKSKIRKITNW